MPRRPSSAPMKEINAGIYGFALAPLFERPAQRSQSGNAQGEYYLPDLVGVYRRRGLTVEARPARLMRSRSRGVNSQAELAQMGAFLRARKNEALMDSGVTLVDPATTYIDDDVQVGTRYHRASGRAARGPDDHRLWLRDSHGSRIVDSVVGDGVTSTLSASCGSRTGRSAAPSSGPLHTCGRSRDVRERAHVGNFVELKKTALGAGSKANHLAYLGDATIGESVNVGAGTITCNYDGARKHPTVIEDGAFIGSDSQLIAPVRDRARGLRGGGLLDHRRRAGRRAGHRARPTGQHAGLGRRAQEGRDVGSSHVRHHRLHRSEARSCRCSSTACAGSSTAATTRPALPSCATGAIESAPERRQARRSSRDAVARRAARRATTASATRAGPPTAGPPRRTRIPTATAPAASSSCTTASSRTTSS